MITLMMLEHHGDAPDLKSLPQLPRRHGRAQPKSTRRTGPDGLCSALLANAPTTVPWDHVIRKSTGALASRRQRRSESSQIRPSYSRGCLGRRVCRPG